MCGRKYDSKEAEGERAVQLLRGPYLPLFDRALKLLSPSFDIRPTNQHAVILIRNGLPTAEIMTWGFKPDWARGTLFNSRDDKLTGRAWGKSFRERRCLVPVGGFYEWTGPKGKRQPHAIHLRESPLMVLAGIWGEHEGRAWYSIITTAAGRFMSRLHDREPVMLPPHALETYLQSETPPLHLICATEDDQLVAFACAYPSKQAPPMPA
jgi:putative SOS response-associated peptidase YedK